MTLVKQVQPLGFDGYRVVLHRDQLGSWVAVTTPRHGLVLWINAALDHDGAEQVYLDLVNAITLDAFTPPPYSATDFTSIRKWRAYLGGNK